MFNPSFPMFLTHWQFTIHKIEVPSKSENIKSQNEKLPLIRNIDEEPDNPATTTEAKFETLLAPGNEDVTKLEKHDRYLGWDDDKDDGISTIRSKFTNLVLKDNENVIEHNEQEIENGEQTFLTPQKQKEEVGEEMEASSHEREAKSQGRRGRPKSIKTFFTPLLNLPEGKL